jgi:hypothetical protein
MKKVILFCLVLIATFAANAQPQMTDEPMISNVKTEETQGEIVFIRSTGMPGAAIAFSTFLDDKLSSKINNKRYTKHSISAGKHKFAVQYYGKRRNNRHVETEIEVAAGQKKYVMLFMRAGFFVNRIYAVEITEAAATKMLVDIPEDGKY